MVILLMRQTQSWITLMFKCIQTLNSGIRVPMILFNKQVVFFSLRYYNSVSRIFYTFLFITYIVIIFPFFESTQVSFTPSFVGC